MGYLYGAADGIKLVTGEVTGMCSSDGSYVVSKDGKLDSLLNIILLGW